jgi:LAGLIDADG-like domain
MISAQYLAGLFDGEGCVVIMRTNFPGGRVGYCVRVSVSNTYKPVLQEVREEFGGSLSGRRPDGNRNKLTLWTWRASGRDSIVFLRRVYPYLHVKREQALLAFEFQEHADRTGRKLSAEVIALRDTLVERMKSLKRVEFPESEPVLDTNTLLADWLS